MQFGNGWLKLDELGSNVRVKNLTPAEAVLLRKQFGIKVPGQSRPTMPLTHLKVHAEPYPGASTEYDRLVKKYGTKAVEASFPGDSPQLPETFESIMDKGESGKPVVLPEEPAKGEPQIVVALQKIPRDDGSDLEPATASKQTSQAADIAKLQAQVEMLTRLLADKTTESQSAVVTNGDKPAAPVEEEDPFKVS